MVAVFGAVLFGELGELGLERGGELEGGRVDAGLEEGYYFEIELWVAGLELFDKRLFLNYEMFTNIMGMEDFWSSR